MIIFEINNTKAIFDEQLYTISLNWETYQPDIRTFEQMKNLYIDELDFDNNDICYLMYRWVYLNNDDKAIFEENNLRYDVTIILPKFFGIEYNKTFWHYHPKRNENSFFEEIYQVLHWKAIYLQQNDNKSFYTKANNQDVVLMENWFWHTTINPSNNVLIMANIVSNKFSSIYDEYKNKKWARYYFTTSWWIKNKNYNDNVKLEESSKLFKSNDIYGDFVKNPKRFSFLN